MLTLRVLATIFVGISFISALIKNINVFQYGYSERKKENAYIFLSTFYGWMWRILVLITIWSI